MAERVKVNGLRELRAAFRELDADTKKGLGKEVSEAATVVRDEARSLVTAYPGASVTTIRVKRSGPVVSVQQSKEKTTSQHPDFGGLQMRHVLIPALDRHQDEVVARVEDAINRWIREAGF